MNNLSEELWLKIFSYLNRREMTVTASVCGFFHRLTRDKDSLKNPYPSCDYKAPLNMQMIKMQIRDYGRHSITVITELTNNLFATGSDDGTIEIWDTDSQQRKKSFHTKKRTINFIEQLNHKTLIFGTWDNALFILNFKTGIFEEIDTKNHTPRMGVLLSDKCLITAAGSAIYVSKNGANDTTLLKWDLTTSKSEVLKLDDKISCIKKLSPDQLLIGSDDGSVSIMNLQNKQTTNIVSPKDNYYISDIAIHENIVILFSIHIPNLGYKSKLMILDKVNFKLIKELELSLWARQLSISNGGDILLLGVPTAININKNNFIILEKNSLQLINTICVNTIPDKICCLSNGNIILGTNKGGLQLHRFMFTKSSTMEPIQNEVIQDKKRRCMIL